MNNSEIRQMIKNDIETNIGLNFEADMSQSCTQLTNAEQKIENVNIVGSKDVAIRQVNNAHALCELKTISDMAIVNDLSSSTQSALKDTLSQAGGLIPGINNTKKQQDVINAITTNVDTDIWLNQAKECIQKVDQSQNIIGINIEDSLNVNISQANSGIIQCMGDGLSKFHNDVTVATKALSDVTSETDQSGFLSNIGSIGIGVGVFSCISCCVVIVIAIIMLTSGGGKDAAPDDMAHCQNYGVNRVSDCSADPKCLWVPGEQECRPTGYQAGGWNQAGGFLFGGGYQYGGVSGQILGRTGDFFRSVFDWVRASPVSSFVIIALVVLVISSSMKKSKKDETSVDEKM